MSLKRFFLSIITCFTFFFLVTQTQAIEHIPAFDTSITINKNGTIRVTENIMYDFGEADKHGIYRDIPYIKTNKEGKRYELKFSDISVENESGQDYQYTTSWNDGILRIKIGDADTYVTGVNTYVIKYIVSGALTYFSDHDELYWNVTGDKWPAAIGQATARITLPTEISAEQIKTVCFTGVNGSTEASCDVVPNASIVSIAAQRELSVGEGMTAVIGFPKNIVAVLEPKEYKEFFETWLGKLVFFGILVAMGGWYFILPLYIMYRWYRYGRDPKPMSGPVSSWFEPPTYSHGAPLTSAETGVLIDETATDKEISALIIDLARRGYFKIVEKKEKDFEFVKQKEFEGELLPYERHFLRTLFKDATTIRLKDKKLYTLVEATKKSLYDKLVAEKFFVEHPETVRTRYTVLGIFALVTLNIPLALVSFTFGRAMVRKTLAGAEAAAVTQSLKNFLGSQERQLEFQAQKQLFFEKLLPFAIAFGVEKIWAERFKDLHLQEPDWYEGQYGNRGFSTHMFTRSLSSSFSQVATAATPPTSTNSSSGFSSGFSGGSSGGGGGGGGGGSW